MSYHVIEEAERCLRCKKPLCRAGCPVNTDIPKMVELILDNKIEEAGGMLFENNPLSVVCAWVCPHEEQCEGHCVLNRKKQAIQVSEMERYVSDYYLETMDLRPQQIQEENVAIIGSGPAGMALAYMLALKGYPVTMFDNHDKIGGVTRYGIPEFRLPKSVVDRIHNQLVRLGVVIRPNTLIGPNITLDDLFEDGYKAVFVGTGVWKPRKLRIKGESLGNVHFAIDYLKNPDVYSLGAKVIVIGGGNVAMDVARTALRNGSIDVTVVYRKGEEHLPARSEEIKYAKLDGVSFEYYKNPKELTKEGLIYQSTRFYQNEEGRYIFEVDEGSEELMEANSILIAASQEAQETIVAHTKGVDTNDKGLVLTNQYGNTTREGVFAAGDVVTGANTVVEAVKQAKVTAQAMDEYLQSKRR